MRRFCLPTLLALAIPLCAHAQHTMVMHSPESAQAAENSPCRMSEKPTDNPWEHHIDPFPSTLIGTLSHPVSTQSQLAQQYFNQGLTFFYCFDTISAMQSFHEATKADSHLAMGYWGVALAAGGDLNIPIDDPCMKLAIAQAKLALANLAYASPAERLYINAILERYGLDGPLQPEKRDPAQLSVPYMQAMEIAWRQLFVNTKSPDPDVASLYAVSLMNLRPWLWWTTSGQQSDEITRALDVLRRGLKLSQFKEHLGLNHFYGGSAGGRGGEGGTSLRRPSYATRSGAHTASSSHARPHLPARWRLGQRHKRQRACCAC
jgi:hypothetical protein